MSKDRLSIICKSGNFDDALATFTLASGAAALGYEVNLFFTFWGLDIIKKKRGRALLGKGILSKCFNFLLGGRNKLPLSRLNFAGISPELLTMLMKKRNIAPLDEIIQASIDLGVNFYACEMAYHMFGFEREDLIPEVKDVIGVSTFLLMSKDSQTLFI